MRRDERIRAAEKHARVVASGLNHMDHERLRFHIASGDYFATLSALLGFVEERLKSLEGDVESEECAVLRHTRADLQYLHEHFVIREK